MVWLLDSFEGLPEVNLDHFPGDSPHEQHVKFANAAVLEQNTLESVQERMRNIGLYDEAGTKYLKGLFKDR